MGVNKAIHLALLVALAACSSTSTPRPGGTTASHGGGGQQGYYKIGNPYTINGVLYTPAFDPNYDETGIASWYAGAFTGQPTGNGELYDPNQLTAAHRTLPMPSLVRVTNLENGRALIVRVNDRGPYASNRIIDLSRRCAQLLGMEKQGTAKVRVQILAKESEALADAARHGQLATSVADAIETNPVQSGTLEAADVPQKAAAERVVEAAPLADTTGGLQSVDEKAVIKSETGVMPKGQDVGGRFLPAQVVHKEIVGKTKIYIQAGAFSSQDNAAKLRDRLQMLGTQILPANVNGKDLYRVRIGPLPDVASADAELAKVTQAGAPEAKIVVE
jgi:rare lipoprotein A